MKNYSARTIAKALENGLFTLMNKLTTLILPALLLGGILLFVLAMHGMDNGVLTDSFIKYYQPISPITIAPIQTHYAIV